MSPNNQRPPLTTDLDRCAWHPDRETVGWRDVASEDGGAPVAVGVCVECAIDLGGTDGAGGANLISTGSPCLCGPGFCAYARGLGFVGVCSGARPNAGPDCGRCGASHQSDAGCWLCLPNSNAWERENTQAYLRMLAAGVTGAEVFDYQEAEVRAGRRPTFAEAADAVIAKRRSAS